MPFFKLSDSEPETLFGSLTKRLAAYGGGLMAVQVHLPEGSVAPEHQHPHEQITYVIHGRVSYRIGAETGELAGGDSAYVPGDTGHEVTALEDTLVVDVFSPQREDFLPST
ncbi:MAG: cupin domain-containing protein [Spirochaetes bacterium]|jgi:quercetin dioxygenase-like cupin family protein|nr:cupin domain-containing protein [Spirochaetota bacterium]